MSLSTATTGYGAFNQRFDKQDGVPFELFWKEEGLKQVESHIAARFDTKWVKTLTQTSYQSAAARMLFEKALQQALDRRKHMRAATSVSSSSSSSTAVTASTTTQRRNKRATTSASSSSSSSSTSTVSTAPGSSGPTAEEILQWVLNDDTKKLESYNKLQATTKQDGIYLRSPEDTIRAIATAVWQGLTEVIGNEEFTIIKLNDSISGNKLQDQDPKELLDLAKQHFRLDEGTITKAMEARLAKLRTAASGSTMAANAVA